MSTNAIPTTPAANETPDKYIVPGLERGLRLLGEFSSKDRSMSARSACPSSKASQSATAIPSSSTSTPVEANTSQLGNTPRGMIRMALASAKNNVAITSTGNTEPGRGRFRTAATIAASAANEITTNISQWPNRSGGSTSPANAAPTNASAATSTTAPISPTRPRQ